MTLGPAIVFLGLRRSRPATRSQSAYYVFGRMPLLYFVLHIPLIHVIAIALDVAALRRRAVPLPAAADARNASRRISAGLRLAALGGLRRHGCGGAGAVSVLPVVLASAHEAPRVVDELFVGYVGGPRAVSAFLSARGAPPPLAYALRATAFGLSARLRWAAYFAHSYWDPDAALRISASGLRIRDTNRSRSLRHRPNPLRSSPINCSGLN